MTPTSPLWVGIEVTARPLAAGAEAVGWVLGLAAGAVEVAGLLVVLDGLDWGETSAVGLEEPPAKVQDAAKIAVAARKQTARPRPLIFC